MEDNFVTSGRAVLGRYVSRNLDWTEGEEVDLDAAADLVNLCYENSLREFECAEDALTQTYVCFIRSTSQLEISVHSPSNATVTYQSQDVLTRGFLGMGRKPYTKEATVRERDQVLQILRAFFHERDSGTLVSKVEGLIGA